MTTTTLGPPALLTRVRSGNDKFNEQWSRAKAAAGDPAKWTRITDEIRVSWPRLDILCRQLMAEGYHGCLYPDNPECVFLQLNNEHVCFVCPRG